MRKNSLLLFIILHLCLAGPAAAQASGPIYIVQSGDTLWSIAARFNVTVDELMTANGIANADMLSAGQQLIIPGLEGLTGILDTEVVGFGDSLRGLSRRNQVPVSMLQKLNRIISPSELYVGVSLIVPQQDGGNALTASNTPLPGESCSNLLSGADSDPWTLSTLNQSERHMGRAPRRYSLLSQRCTHSNRQRIALRIPECGSQVPAAQAGRHGRDYCQT
jgi:LysM repeat protein